MVRVPQGGRKAAFLFGIIHYIWIMDDWYKDDVNFKWAERVFFAGMVFLLVLTCSFVHQSSEMDSEKHVPDTLVIGKHKIPLEKPKKKWTQETITP